MRISFDRLRAAGFDVQTNDDEVIIYSRAPNRELIEILKREVPSDVALQEYVVGAALVAIERAQILALCE